MSAVLARLQVRGERTIAVCERIRITFVYKAIHTRSELPYFVTDSMLVMITHVTFSMALAMRAAFADGDRCEAARYEA
jgi:hypothetical protein